MRLFADVRLDRGLTLNLFRAISSTPTDAPDGYLPVLMYHRVANDSESELHPYYRTTTSPSRLGEHLTWLRELGFTGMSLESVLTMTPAERRVRRPVVLTFDDGYHDFYTAAWPLLCRHHFTATVYLPTGFIATTRRTFLGRGCLTWGEVRQLHRDGVRFGSHTVNHPRLHQLSWEAIERETALSKDHIEHEVQEPVRSFAYPYAFPQEDSEFTKRLVSLLQSLGYHSCATTMVGRARAGPEAFYVRRLPVNTCDDQPLLAAKLGGAYDWLGFVQLIMRRGKQICRGGRSTP